ncbi:RIP metalloprotease RseP [Geminisphaera colitermitum]|uniref:RIP metalloprotease RseP n=1 Tax=Geminisphaera colitermitum TaxID=1148786 RepID=UPI000158CC10|nr:RIP metalloprotease RseP [Geminisphaera colitermitum]
MSITTVLSLLWALVLMALFFGGSIFVHELGHFLAARRRGVKVDRFSIGFGPKIFAWTGKDGVEYRLSWIPLGGYVALPQLADMRGIEGEPTSVASDLDVGRSTLDVGCSGRSPAPPPSYSTKMLVFVAGAVCNIIFAFALASILWIAGLPQEEPTQIGYVASTLVTTDGNKIPSPGATAGLRPGDIITHVDGKAVSRFREIEDLVILGSGRTPDGSPEVALTVLRDNTPLTLSLIPAYVGPERIRSIGIAPSANPAVDSFSADSAARDAGLRIGDIITHIDDRAAYYVGSISDYLREHGAKPVRVSGLRDGQPFTLTVTPRLVNDENTGQPVPRIGVLLNPHILNAPLVHIPPHEQIARHIRTTWRTIVSLVSPKSDIGVSKLSGPVGIAHVFIRLAQVDLRSVIWFTVLLNINLAIFNLLPIPVLDGGHMMFATIGKLRGRPLPMKFVMNTQAVFMALLLTMILYVSFFDIRRVKRDIMPDTPAVEQPADAPAK